MKPLEVTATHAQMAHHEGLVDACIIGCGAAGSVLAKELAEAGWRVVVLEAGPWLTTDQDLRQDEVEMLGKFDWDDRRWREGNETLALGHRRDGRGVGGGTLHYGGVALRLWPEDFERASRDGVGADWPITYAELEPYYNRVEREMKLSGPLSLPWGPRRGRYPQPPHRLSARDLVFATAMQRLGMQWSENALAILTGHHEGRSPCMNYGYCQWGCKSRAKTSTAVSYVPKAVLAGAEVRDNSRVTLLESDPSGRISGVVYERGGIEERLQADLVILSAFCIENPRLLLHSATPAFPEGLANRSDWVGRGIMAHVAESLMGRFSEPVHQWSTSPGALLSQDDYGTQASRAFAGGWSWMTASHFPAEFGTTLAKSGSGLWGERLVELLEAYPYFATLGSEGECLSYPDNRVRLSGEVDEYGVARPLVTFNFEDNERQMRQEIERRGRLILEEAGAVETFVSQGNDHTMGGCRMGDDPTTSVVDRDLKAHDHPNLYICDASVFPSSGGAQPSQTIMALATRLADHLAGRLSPGRPSSANAT